MTLEINVGETSSITPVINYTPDSIDEYMVVVNLPEDWSVVHNYIINENEIDGIPNRKVECSNDQSYSLRTSIYMMSAAEAEVLKTHSKVETVELNPDKYPQPQSSDILRFKKDVAFNKPFITAAMGSESIVYNNGIRANWSMLFASEPSGKPYRGVGITSTDTVNRDLSFSLTGKGVDAVTIDSGVAALHPEFLDGNGKSRVRDVILDGPYKVDPDYFVGLGVTYNKVIDGVDIGVGIATTSAEEWWENTSKRSSKFSSLGTVSIPSTYTIGQAFSKTSSGESNPITGGHGTACASQIGGKSFGLAIEANLWNIRIALTGDGGVISGSTAINACTIWHNAKKINSTDPDPTILNNSWGSGSECGDSNGTSYNYWYRGSSLSYTGNNSDTNAQANIPCCANKGFRYRLTGTTYNGAYGGKGEYLPASSTTSSAAENAIAAGVIVLASAGNKNQKISHKDDVDFNNAYSSSTNYINRAGGVQKGFSGDHDKGKGSIRVGALDCAVEPSNELQGATKYTPRKVCYSSNGPMIDIWAPGDKTMSAGYASYESYQRQDDSSFYDYWFGGTSAACPNTVSLVSLYLQSNRSANQDCVRHWLINHASKEGVVSDPYPDINDSAYWATNTVDTPTVDYESYNNRGCGNLRGAPNRALFNPYASDVVSGIATDNWSKYDTSYRVIQDGLRVNWDYNNTNCYSGIGTIVTNLDLGQPPGIPGVPDTSTYGKGVIIGSNDPELDETTFASTVGSVMDYSSRNETDIRIIEDQDWPSSGDVSVSYWIYSTSFPGTYNTYFLSRAGNWDMVLMIRESGGSRKLTFEGGGVNGYTYGDDEVFANKWHNFALTWNTSTEIVRMFLDGKVQGGDITGRTRQTDQDLYLGEYRSSTHGFLGYIADLRMYDRVLSDAEVKQNYDALAPKFKDGTEVKSKLTLKMGGSNTPPDNWTAISGIEESGWRGICYGNGKFVATSLTGTNQVTYSTDGINWTAASASEAHYWYSVVYGNGKYVSVGYVNYSNDVDRVMYSTNGINWTTANATYNHRWVSVCYGNGYFVAVADDDWQGGSNANKRVMYSTDGINWTAGPIVSGNAWKSVCYGNGKFVAVASDGSQRVMYASDSNLGSWTNANAAEANGWHNVTYGNGKFVAVANSGTNRVMYSTDGINWSNSGLSGVESDWWYGVTYGNGYFVAVASSGSTKVMYSTDGISWTAASSPITTEPWWGIAYGNGKFVATQLMEGGQGGSSGSTTTQMMYSTVDGFTTTSGGGRGLTIG